ncbi:M48 family metallopeptidase [Photobacterium kagoshimensis]|uniref:M48 family metallopeptidase n=1 Tax=Photobacterium kagoshimensis TaxID=2910242 RepID=UPI003D132FFF
MIIRGFCHPPRSTEKQAASVMLLSEGRLQLSTAQGHHVMPLEVVNISEPLGRLPIRLAFPDGSQFIPYNSLLLEGVLKARKRTWLHWIERYLPIIASGLVLMGLLFALFFTHGLPWLTSGIVKALPQDISVRVGQHVLQTLDEKALAPTELSMVQQALMKQRFQTMVAQLPPMPVKPQLRFRRWHARPNALALSDGSIVVFDALVTLAKTPEQLDSILLHELGHIQHQHVMKSIVRSTLLSTSVALLTDDHAELIDTFNGSGVFFVMQGYSRKAELEADEFAVRSMLDLYGTTEPMQQMLQLFMTPNGLANELPEWINTHPALETRVERLGE